MRRMLALLLCLGSPAWAQVAAPPELLGIVAGPGAVVEPPGVRFYGTDLGWTFEHRGTHHMLFGDTWSHPRSLCEALPHNDDAQATFPLAPPPGGLPTLTVTTDPAAPAEFARIRLLRDGQSAVMGYNKTPLTAFSDGTDAVVLFGLIEATRCRLRRGRPSCRPHDHLTCSQAVGLCSPPFLGFQVPCDLGTGAGCAFGQTCEPTPNGICVDPTTAQGNLPAKAAFDTHVGIQAPERPADYHDIGTIASNKFFNPTARAVRCLSGRRCGNDWTPGHGAVLVWGRPGWDAVAGGQAHLYLMVHKLPLRRNRDGDLHFRPRYFAGVKPGSGEPIWTTDESRAKALAMDGVVDGDPDDPHPFPNHMTVSWLGPPVNRWMMLYGGGSSDVSGGVGTDVRGPILVRFAEQPWGPWSPPQVHLDPGDPSTVGAPFGPGGYMFHPECEDAPPALCARSDPTRPLDHFFPGCPEVGAAVDTGILYGAHIVDAYTRPDGLGGLEVSWLASVWNPYAVPFFRTIVRPGPPASTCTSSKRGPLRWCAPE